MKLEFFSEGTEKQVFDTIADAARKSGIKPETIRYTLQNKN